MVRPPMALKATAVNDHEELLRKLDFNSDLFLTKLLLFEEKVQ